MQQIGKWMKKLRRTIDQEKEQLYAVGQAPIHDSQEMIQGLIVRDMDYDYKGFWSATRHCALTPTFSIPFLFLKFPLCSIIQEHLLI